MTDFDSGIMKAMEESSHTLFYGTTPVATCKGKRKLQENTTARTRANM
jgi:hypothetical protein